MLSFIIKERVIFNEKDPCFFGYKLIIFKCGFSLIKWLALIYKDNVGKCKNLKLLKTEKRQHSN